MSAGVIRREDRHTAERAETVMREYTKGQKLRDRIHAALCALPTPVRAIMGGLPEAAHHDPPVALRAAARMLASCTSRQFGHYAHPMGAIAEDIADALSPCGDDWTPDLADRVVKVIERVGNMCLNGTWDRAEAPDRWTEWPPRPRPGGKGARDRRRDRRKSDG